MDPKPLAHKAANTLLPAFAGAVLATACWIAGLGLFGASDLFGAIATICNLIVAGGVFFAALTYRANVAQHIAESTRSRSESYMNVAHQAAQRAFSLLTSNGKLDRPPIADRLLWLTTARALRDFSKFREQVVEPDHEAMLEDNIEFLRTRLQVLFDNFQRHMDSRYFKRANPIDPTSIAIVLAFIDWPKEKRDSIADVAGTDLVAKGIVPINYFGIRDYLTRHPGYAEALDIGDDARGVIKSAFPGSSSSE